MGIFTLEMKETPTLVGNLLYEAPLVQIKDNKMNHRFSTSSKKALMIIALSFFAINNSIFALSKEFEINKMIQLYHDYGQFNGAVLVADDRKVIFKKGYGLANMEWNIPNHQ